MSDVMRDRCIAYETIRRVLRSMATGDGRTVEQIADDAIRVVDVECASGNLGLLYYSWCADPDETRWHHGRIVAP